ncbi:MAG: HDIG domain-containing protein [Chrysiogenetes bacterium]|nr:HDIG domain-containing protein [Chrysiogenetes bacterium]
MSPQPTKRTRGKDDGDTTRPRRAGAPRGKGAESAEEEQSRNRKALATRILVWAGISILIGLVISPPTVLRLRQYEVGDIAVGNIKAPRDLAVEDHLSTSQRRAEAMERVLPIFDYDEDAARSVANQVAAWFGAVRQNNRRIWELEDQIEALKKERNSGSRVAELREKLAEAREAAKESPPTATQFLNKEIEDSTAKALASVRYGTEVEDRIVRAVEQILRPGVIGSSADFPVGDAAEITVRRIPSNSENVEHELGRFVDLETARAQAGDVVKEWLADSPYPKDTALRKALTQLVRKLLRPNLAKNIQATDARRELAASQVKPVYLNLKAGEIFVREGERINSEDVIILSALSKEEKHTQRWLSFALVSVLAGLLIGMLYFFARQHLHYFNAGINDLQFYAIVLALQLLSVRLATDPWQWSGFVAFGAMLMRVVLPADISLFHALIASIAAGLLVQAGPLYVLYSMVGSMLVIWMVSQYQHRLVVIRTGMVLGAINVIFYWTDLYVNHDLLIPSDWQQLVILFGLGVGGAFAVSQVSYFAERLFNYTSALRLMELNDTSHPLVKEVFFKTPGTYQHSLVIGTIAEAAAKAIGADALLVRVAAMYHDIGKTKMPQYFIENMVDSGKASPHKKLSPNMSAIIISSHVKDGIEMAHEAGLPQRVIDMIPQHHGTKLMKYFWEKAKAEQTEDMPPLNEDDFRYPGPKPQSKEGGIMLLADAIEAAVRTLPDFTEARIRGAVQKLVNDAFADGQLDECDLTLKDLNEIAKAFSKTLAAFHHGRIKYPEPAEKQRKKQENADSRPKDAEQPEGGQPAAEEARSENLKRLGN